MRFFTVISSMVLFMVCDQASASGTLEGMCKRLFPEHASSFCFELLKDYTDVDRFVLQTVKGKVVIKGNNNNSLAVGLNYYLNNYCHTNVSWYAADAVEMPDRLPEVKTLVASRAKVQDRFFLNYCTYGYTMPFWKWEDWERLIDWMALNGVTMPLAITGQEAIWQKVWMKMGLSDEQVRSYFTGPAHLPWHRMANVDYWQSPLPQSWIDNQRALQLLILKREREFNMTPVLPAFSGHVPGELSEYCPEAKIYKMSKWGGFDDQYRSHFIDPMDPLYNVIQKMYLEEQTALYGTDHIYGVDPFNEIDSPDWSEGFLAASSSRIYESIRAIDPEARWLQMTWMFYYDRKNWTQPRIKAFLGGVPDDGLVLLDYFCDYMEIWRQTEKYYGKPYIWCYLGNFGGNTMIIGDLKDTDTKLDRVFADGGTGLKGVGATLEGLDVNPLMYEFLFYKAWEHAGDVADFVDVWAKTRGGDRSPEILDAWRMLRDSVYTMHCYGNQSVPMNVRPRLNAKGFAPYPNINYDNSTLWVIWEKLLRAEIAANGKHRYDVVNVGRQVLGNLSMTFRDEFILCYNNKDIAGMRLWAGRMDELMTDVDRLLLCEPSFSLGKWIADARSFGLNDPERNYYEENARCLLTVWGQKATELNDYSTRGWAGLTDSYYRERWNRFAQGVIAAAEAGEDFDEGKFYNDITEFEYQWTLRHNSFPVHSNENPLTLARELRDKYSIYFEAEK